MKYVMLVVIALLLATSASAQIIPPPPTGSLLDPVNGIALIGWENSIHADLVVAVLNRTDCLIATNEAVQNSGDPQQAITQVPAGPPFPTRCLLRPGDHVFLQRWRAGRHIDTIGPYAVPLHVWLPFIAAP